MAADAASPDDRQVHAKSRRDRDAPLVTPDGRYIVVRGRLWRRTNPGLSEAQRAEWVKDLMSARRAVGVASRSGDGAALAAARANVHDAKVNLGERGAVWWNDGAPDQHRRMVRNTHYADWIAAAERVADENASPARAP